LSKPQEFARKQFKKWHFVIFPHFFTIFKAKFSEKIGLTNPTTSASTLELVFDFFELIIGEFGECTEIQLE
jgi:hypothetical protein